MRNKKKVGRPLKFNSAKNLKNKIDNYFKNCEKKNKPFTVTGLALALNMTSRKQLIEYQGRSQFATLIKKAKLMCENYVDTFLFSHNQVAGAIFNLKNNYGWTDKIETEIKTPVQIQIVNLPSKYDNKEKITGSRTEKNSVAT